MSAVSAEDRMTLCQDVRGHRRRPDTLAQSAGSPCHGWGRGFESLRPRESNWASGIDGRGAGGSSRAVMTPGNGGRPYRVELPLASPGLMSSFETFVPLSDRSAISPLLA